MMVSCEQTNDTPSISLLSVTVKKLVRQLFHHRSQSRFHNSNPRLLVTPYNFFLDLYKNQLYVVVIMSIKIRVTNHLSDSEIRRNYNIMKLLFTFSVSLISISSRQLSPYRYYFAYKKLLYIILLIDLSK